MKYKEIYYLLLLIAMIIEGSDVNENAKKCTHIISNEWKISQDVMNAFKNHHSDIFKALKSFDGDSYYRGLRYQSDQAVLFDTYMISRVTIVQEITKALKKTYGLADVDSIKKQKKEQSEALKKFCEQQKKFQKDHQYCHLCKNYSFKQYHDAQFLVDGYEYLEEIPQVSLFLKDKSFTQLKGQLNGLQINYVNLVHWMHHELETQGVYRQIRNLKPISFGHNGQTVTISKWDPLHIFMGNLKRGFFAGVHSENRDLFTHFYKRDNDQITIRNHDAYHKISTFFPNSWKMNDCMNKAYEALQNIIKIEKGDAKYGNENYLLVHGKTNNGIAINCVVDPANNLVISFYPE